MIEGPLLPSDVEPLPEIVQVCDEITPNLTRLTGVNLPLARVVAAMTGDPIAGPVGTVGWAGDNTYFAAVFHGTHDGRVELSLAEGGLPLSRAILSFLAELAFDYGTSEVLIRVRVEDLPFRDTLRRLGFKRIRTDAGRHVYSLCAQDIPEPYRAARLRRKQ